MRSRPATVVAATLTAVSLAACADGGEPETIAPDAADVILVGTDALKFDPAEATVAAGEVRIGLEAGTSVLHNVVIEGVAGDDPVVEVAAGDAAVGTVTLTAGTYTFFCSVPGHRNAGMEGTLTVE